MTDDGSRSADVQTTETDRRRLLTMLGVGGAAAVAGVLASSDEAHAGHDGTNTFHLGEENVAPGNPMQTTALRGDGGTPVLDVSNAGTSSAISASTEAPTGGAITAFGESWGVVGHGDDAGIQGFSFSGTGAGVSGHSDGAGTGVSGITDTGTGVSGGSGSGTGTGVSGMTETGTGVHGHSSSSGTAVLGESATGTAGHFESTTGTAGHFQSAEGQALDVHGPAQFGGAPPSDGSLVAMASDHDNFVLGIENFHDGGGSGGILVSSSGGKPAIEADAHWTPDHDGVAVQGVSGGGATFGQGPGTGVEGISGSGTGVHGTSDTGVGGLFTTTSGLALQTDGKAAFSTAGSSVVPAGSDSVFVANADVTADSHISVTLMSDPGTRELGWVDRHPGNGFTVHLASGKPGPSNPSQRPATALTYVIIEPAS